MKPPCDEAVIRSMSAAAPCRPEVKRWILAAAVLGSSMAFLDSTVVNVALPALQTSLGATVVGVQWVVESYGLFLGALILVGGSLGDLLGTSLDISNGCSHLCDRIRRLWIRRKYSAVADRTECSRCGSRPSGTWQPGDHQRIFR